MRFVIRQRGEGKTTAAVAWLREDPANRVILTCNEQMAAYLRRQHGLTDRQVSSYRSASALRGRTVAVAVEDLDTMLGQLLGTGGAIRIELVTATGEAI